MISRRIRKSRSDRVVTEMPVRRGRGAGGHGFAVALDLDEAEPAGTEGQQALVVAEGGDVDAPFPRRLEDRLARLGS